MLALAFPERRRVVDRVAGARELDIELEAHAARGEALGEVVAEVVGAALARLRDGERPATRCRQPVPARPASAAAGIERRKAWTAW